MLSQPWLPQHGGLRTGDIPPCSLGPLHGARSKKKREGGGQTDDPACYLLQTLGMGPKWTNSVHCCCNGCPARVGLRPQTFFLSASDISFQGRMASSEEERIKVYQIIKLFIKLRPKHLIDHV